MIVMGTRDDRLGDLNELKSSLKAYDCKVSDSLWLHEEDQTKLNKEVDSCEDYQSKLNKTIRKLTSLKIIDVDAIEANLRLIPNPVSTSLKLPQLPLPEYSHAKDEQFEEFIDKLKQAWRSLHSPNMISSYA